MTIFIHVPSKFPPFDQFFNCILDVDVLVGLMHMEFVKYIIFLFSSVYGLLHELEVLHPTSLNFVME